MVVRRVWRHIFGRASLGSEPRKNALLGERGPGWKIAVNLLTDSTSRPVFESPLRLNAGRPWKQRDKSRSARSYQYKVVSRFQPHRRQSDSDQVRRRRRAQAILSADEAIRGYNGAGAAIPRRGWPRRCSEGHYVSEMIKDRAATPGRDG